MLRLTEKNKKLSSANYFVIFAIVSCDAISPVNATARYRRINRKVGYGGKCSKNVGHIQYTYVLHGITKIMRIRRRGGERNDVSSVDLRSWSKVGS